MNMPTLSIIVPTHNAAKTVRLLVDQLQENLKDFRFEIFLVDDASIDDTRQEILDLVKKNSHIRHFFSTENQGQQASLLIGLRMLPGDCDYVITMDDDLQNPVEMIRILVEKIQEGYDLVYGIPECTPGPKQKSPSVYRRLGSGLRDRLFDSFPNKPSGIKVSAFRIMTRELAAKTAKSKKKYFYLSAESFLYDIKVANVPYSFRPRAHGKSSYTWKRLFIIYFRLLATYKFNFM